MNKLMKVVLALTVLLAVPATVYLVAFRGSTEYRAKAGQAKEAFVFLTPNQVSTKKGDLFSLSVKIDTGSEVVGGVEMVIDYDQNVMALVGEVQKGVAFSELSRQVEPGRITLRGQEELIGQATVATLTFRGLRRGEGAVNVGGGSVVWDEKITTNILDQVAGAKVMIE